MMMPSKVVGAATSTFVIAEGVVVCAEELPSTKKLGAMHGFFDWAAWEDFAWPTGTF